MKSLAILEAGRPPAELSSRYPTYATMATGLIEAGLTVPATIKSYAVLDGEFPAASTDHDGYLITGSAAGVYDDLPWIDPLLAFIRAVAAANRPQVGICFGHQALAAAFGGVVTKSPKGWGLGLHRYATLAPPPLAPARWPEEVAVRVIHQDQVESLPPQAVHLGGNTHCPYGMFYLPQHRAIGVQGHPEFAADYLTALITIREGVRFDSTTAAIARASLRAANAQNELFAQWIAAFLMADVDA
mgnify:FL=1